MAEVISHLFRLPANGRPMTIMQLAGFPAEVVDSVVSVLCRMAFDFGLWSDGVSPLLFVCEEAHRYASADRNIGFGPTRKAVSRIAKEGRKYGVFLGLVTQRPAELDATIISQCNTLFAMRLANDRDQALLRSAVSDAAANLLSFVPSLGSREVLAFGEGVALPTRLRFKEVPPHQLPRSEATIATTPAVAAGHDMHFVSAVLDRWRGATSNRDAPNEPAGMDRPAIRAVEAPMLQPSMGLDPDRFRAFFAYHDALMEKDGGLTKAEREMIVVATSSANQCQYCVIAHGAILRIRAKNPLIADQIAVNYRKADITARQRAMLDFAMKVAIEAHRISEADFAAVTAHGFSHDDIWDIAAIAAFFALSNRMANVTGMRPNDEFYLLGRLPK